jgi:hypothetical protein
MREINQHPKRLRSMRRAFSSLRSRPRSSERVRSDGEPKTSEVDAVGVETEIQFQKVAEVKPEVRAPKLDEQPKPAPVFPDDDLSQECSVKKILSSVSSLSKLLRQGSMEEESDLFKNPFFLKPKESEGFDNLLRSHTSLSQIIKHHAQKVPQVKRGVSDPVQVSEPDELKNERSVLSEDSLSNAMGERLFEDSEGLVAGPERNNIRSSRQIDSVPSTEDSITVLTRTGVSSSSSQIESLGSGVRSINSPMGKGHIQGDNISSRFGHLLRDRAGPTTIVQMMDFRRKLWSYLGFDHDEGFEQEPECDETAATDNWDSDSFEVETIGSILSYDSAYSYQKEPSCSCVCGI